MSVPSGRGPIVVDTDVYGAELVPGSRLAELYEPLIVGRPVFISFQTAAELRFGALLRNWGEARLRKLDARIGAAETVHTGPELPMPSSGWPAIAAAMRWRNENTTLTVQANTLPWETNVSDSVRHILVKAETESPSSYAHVSCSVVPTDKRAPSLENSGIGVHSSVSCALPSGTG